MPIPFALLRSLFVVQISLTAALSTSASPVSYDITGRLLRTVTQGTPVEPTSQAWASTAPAFTARVTLETGTPDSDPSATRAVYAGAVTASSFSVDGFSTIETGYCNLEPGIFDCSVVAADQHPVVGLLADIYQLNSQVFNMPASALLPATVPFSFLTFDLSIFNFLINSGSLFDGTPVDPDLRLLPSRMNTIGSNGFHVDVRGGDGSYGVFWSAEDLQITRAGDAVDNTVPEPGTGALLLLASLTAWISRAQKRHSTA